MRFVIIGFILLFVLGGAGFGAYTYYVSPAFAGDDSARVTHKKGSDEHDQGAGYGATDYEFVEIDPLMLPIIDENGLSQVVSLMIAIELKRASYLQRVLEMEPKIKHAYIRAIYGYLSKQMALNPGGGVKVRALKERLSLVTVNLLGDDVVNDVLLTVVQQRPAS